MLDIGKSYRPKVLAPGTRVRVKDSPLTRKDGTAKTSGTVVEYVGPRSQAYVVRLDDGRTVYLHFLDLLAIWVRG